MTTANDPILAQGSCYQQATQGSSSTLPEGPHLEAFLSSQLVGLKVCGLDFHDSAFKHSLLLQLVLKSCSPSEPLPHLVSRYVVFWLHPFLSLTDSSSISFLDHWLQVRDFLPTLSRLMSYSRAVDRNRQVTGMAVSP